MKNISIFISFLLVQATTGLAVIPDGAPSAKPCQGLVSSRMFQASARALIGHSTNDYALIDQAIASLSGGGESEGVQYDWKHAFLFSAAVHAAEVGDAARACEMLDAYIACARFVDPHRVLPDEILHCKAFGKVRTTTAKSVEHLLKRWSDWRYSLHRHKPGMVGHELETALALRMLLAAPVEVDAFARQDGTALQHVPLGDMHQTWTLLGALRALKDRVPEAEAERVWISLARIAPSCDATESALIRRMLDPPLVFLALRARALLTLLLIIAVAIALFVARTARYHPQDPHATDEACNEAFQIDSGDLFSILVNRRLHLSNVGVFASGFLLLFGGIVALAWSEETLHRESCVVDRAFFDYISFSYGYGLLIPLFLAGSQEFYKLVRDKTATVLRLCFPGRDGGVSKEVMAVWRRRLRFCNSNGFNLACFAVSLVILLWQKHQWYLDAGTAFVDLRYPGHYSLTGAYYSLVFFGVVYCLLSFAGRGIAVMAFITIVFSKKWRSKNGVGVFISPNHADGCGGLRPLGLIMINLYLLLLLFVVQIFLNAYEKFRFYETMDIVIQNTSVSVVGFGFLILFAPVLLGPPLLSIHMAMREFQMEEALRLSTQIAQYEARLLDHVVTNRSSLVEIQGFDVLKSLQQEINGMPLWPFNLIYFGTAYFAPVLTLVLKFVKIDLA